MWMFIQITHFVELIYIDALIVIKLYVLPVAPLAQSSVLLLLF